MLHSWLNTTTAIIVQEANYNNIISMATTSIVSAYVVNHYFNASIATHIHIIYVADVVTSVTCNCCASY